MTGPLTGRTVIGYPDRNDRSAISVETVATGFRHRIGWVVRRENRYFAEALDGMPIEGTFRTKRAAADAVRNAS